MENSMANRKKNNAVRYSGIMAVAQKVVVTTVRAATRASAAERNEGGYTIKAIPAATESADITITVPGRFISSM